MRNHGLIVKTVRQRAHHDGRPVAIIVRIAVDIAREAQRFQNAIGGGARQADGSWRGY